MFLFLFGFICSQSKIPRKGAVIKGKINESVDRYGVCCSVFAICCVILVILSLANACVKNINEVFENELKNLNFFFQ